MVVSFNKRDELKEEHIIRVKIRSFILRHPMPILRSYVDV